MGMEGGSFWLQLPQAVLLGTGKGCAMKGSQLGSRSSPEELFPTLPELTAQLSSPNSCPAPSLVPGRTCQAQGRDTGQPPHCQLPSSPHPDHSHHTAGLAISRGHSHCTTTSLAATASSLLLPLQPSP